jgi:hypothetical protein
VQGAQLVVGDHARQGDVELAPLARAGAFPRRSGEQRVRGAHAVALEEQHAGVGGVVERVRPADRRELAGAQVGAQGDGEEQSAHRAREPRHARAEQVFDRIRNREVLADLERLALGQRASELQCEQRVAKRGVDDPAQELPRQAEAEPVGQEAADRADAERADLETLQPFPLERPLQLGPAARTLGEEKANRLALEPARGERERLGGGRIEPLHVVDRDEERLVSGQRAQPVQESDGDRLRVRRCTDGLGPQQRDLQRAQLRGRQLCELVRADAVEQVDQRREGEPRLGAARPGGENAQAVLPRNVGPGLPERGLADARPAGQHERPRGLAGREELAQRGQLRLAADDLLARVSRPRLHLAATVAHAAQRRRARDRCTRRREAAGTVATLRPVA